MGNRLCFCSKTICLYTKKTLSWEGRGDYGIVLRLEEVITNESTHDSLEVLIETSYKNYTFKDFCVKDRFIK